MDGIEMKPGNNLWKVSKEKRLSVLKPEILEFWDDEKNKNDENTKDLDKQLIGCNSEYKVWWKCKHNHSFQKSIKNYFKTKNENCEECKSLKFRYPKIFAEVHPTKNSNLELNKLMPGTSKKIWWKCNLGHEYFSWINGRVNGSGCPKCSSNQTSKEEIRLFSEIKYIFNDTIYRSKIFGKEIDVYIPNLKVGIEFDGSHWHKDDIKDRKKK